MIGNAAGRAHGRHRLVFAFGVMALLAAGGCRTFDVRSDWDMTRSFEADRVFVFLEPPAGPGGDPFADNTLLRKRVRQAIELILSERGFELVGDRAQADLVVTYQVLLEERLRVDGVSSTTGVGYYRYPMGVGTAQTSASVRPYQEATLVIDLLDPATEDLVWRGWGTGMLGTRDRQRSAERLREGVRAILEAFPPESPDAP